MTPDRLDIPVLDTARLRLRAPQGGDAAAHVAFFADTEASRFYGGPLGPVAASNRLTRDIGHWALNGRGGWAVTRLEDARLARPSGLETA